MGDDRHPARPARRARHRRQAAARHGGQALRRGRQAGPEQGETGRIFVGNDLQFEGYTGGGNKDVIDGLMSSGDVGHFDEAGRLFIDGRDDDMIVSGGENVFPAEVEELLAGHDAVNEVAVFGVDDEEFGQRLKARRGDEGRTSSPRTRSRSTSRRTSRGYKVPREVDVHRRAPADVDRQGAQARASGHGRRGRGGDARQLMWRPMALRTDTFDLPRLRLSSGEGRRLDLSVHIDPFHFGGQDYTIVEHLVACGSTSRARRATATRCGCASRPASTAPAPAAFSPAAPRYAVDAREVHFPGGGEELTSPYMGAEDELDVESWARDAFALALPGSIVCRPECAGLCPECGVNLNDEPEHAHETGPDPRWAKLSEFRFELARLKFMAVPKQKQSHARTAQRRAQHKITAPTVNSCPQRHKPRRPHRVCPSCGFYGGREVVQQPRSRPRPLDSAGH